MPEWKSVGAVEADCGERHTVSPSHAGSEWVALERFAIVRPTSTAHFLLYSALFFLLCNCHQRLKASPNQTLSANQYRLQL
jgi:hypothetical protein